MLDFLSGIRHDHFMMTLKELRLDKHRTANYADHSKSPMVCCGWMDIHDDKDSLGPKKNPIFTLDIVYWNPAAVFVYEKNSKWHKLTRSEFIRGKNKYLQFDATKRHGLVTKSIAENLIEKQLAFLQTDVYKDFEQFCSRLTTPKLVWTFID